MRELISINKLANRYADYIERKASNPSPRAITVYGAQTLLEFLLFASIVLIITAITGDFMKGLVSMIAFPLLRYFSGGLHLKSVELCQIISGSLVLLAIYIPITWDVGLILTCVSAVILLITAPSNIARSRIGRKHYPILKLIAVAIVCSNFLFQSELLAKDFFVQSLTTLGFIQRILERYRL